MLFWIQLNLWPLVLILALSMKFAKAIAGLRPVSMRSDEPLPDGLDRPQTEVADSSESRPTEITHGEDNPDCPDSLRNHQKELIPEILRQ